MATCKHLKSLSRQEFREFLNLFDAVLSDCDGVLWREMDVIKGSPETVVKFKQLGKKFFYITNNNCKTRTELVKKCKGMDYDVTEEEILSASYLAALYLKQINFQEKVYVIGSQAIATELEGLGIKHCGVGPDPIDCDELDMLRKFKRDPEIGAVVVGFDKHFSFPKLVKAATYVQDRSIEFIGTNPDVERPSPNENCFPAAGCFLKAIEAIAGRKAKIVGKPEPFVSEVIRKKYGLDPKRTLIIGDTLDTDILLGKRCGFKTLMVMSGITTKDNLTELQQHPEHSIVPDFYCEQLSDILDCLDKFSPTLTMTQQCHTWVMDGEAVRKTAANYCSGSK